jgi:lipopolysaccharide export system permease protein
VGASTRRLTPAVRRDSKERVMLLLGHTIHRMILWELLRVFLLSLLALTGLFLMAGLIAEASQRGLSPSQVLLVIPLLVPNTLPYTIPATTLFATCVVYGRLSHDNEYTAIKAAGINPLTLLRPCLLLGVGTMAVTGGMYYHLIPYTHQVMRQQFLSDGEEVLYNLLKRNRCIRYLSLPYTMYVREVQGRRLVDVIFKRRVKLGNAWVGYDLVAWGREAKLSVVIGPDNKGSIVVDMDRCTVWERQSNSAFFRNRRFEVDLPGELSGSDKRSRPNDMTWVELQQRRSELGGEEREWLAHVAAAKLRQDDPSRPVAEVVAATAAQYPDVGVDTEFLAQDLTTPQALLEPHLGHLKNKLHDTRRLAWTADAEAHMRPALAVGCLCFVLIGCPVGIWFSRADYLSSFVTCFLPTVFAYYPLVLCGSNLSREGKVPVAPAIWAADALFLTVAVVLIAKLMRR